MQAVRDLQQPLGVLRPLVSQFGVRCFGFSVFRIGSTGRACDLCRRLPPILMRLYNSRFARGRFRWIVVSAAGFGGGGGGWD